VFEFAMSKKEEVSLKIYDVLGKEAKVLVDNRLEAVIIL